MTKRSTPLTLGVFDAGIGGLPLAARIRKAAPQYRLVYLGDVARRPYGPQEPGQIVGYVAQAERFFERAGCDAWVVACNTASVVVDQAVAGLLPCIDMVTAVVSDLPAPELGPVGVLATAGTVSSGAFVRALEGYEVHQLATEELLRLAEVGGGVDPRQLWSLAEEAILEMQRRGCTTTILACTDFTCILDEMRAAAEGITALLDPLDSAVDLALAALRGLEETASVRSSSTSPARTTRDRLCLTAPHSVDVGNFARQEFGLALPPIEYVRLDATTPVRDKELLS